MGLLKFRMTRRLNVVFLASLLAVAAAVGAGMHFVHGYQVRRNAGALLDRAHRAEEDGNLEGAEEAVRRYLNLRPTDEAAWDWYARLVDARDTDHRAPDRVLLVHEEALRRSPGNARLEYRCAQLAMDLGRYTDAQRHLGHLLKPENESSVAAAPARLAELEDRLGQCHAGLAQYSEAENAFVRALEYDRGRIACYDRLARLLRGALRRNEDADDNIRKMVDNNPEAGLAYVYRWRYQAELAPPASASDIEAALALAPDDPEVLLTAAIASERRQDAVRARAYYEKGFKLAPQNLGLSLGLAGLEAREGHLERAEGTLRRAFEATHSLDLAFELAENLIAQNKIEEPGQANEYLARLRDARLGNTVVRFLEAEIPFHGKKWPEAVAKLESARAVLGDNPRLSMRLDRMLAECHAQLGHQEQQLDALRRAAEGNQAPESARIAYAGALARSGNVDQALAILLPLEGGHPELRLDVVRLSIQKTLRLPPDQRRWDEVEKRLAEAEKALPNRSDELTELRADVLGFEGKSGPARQSLDQAIRRDPKSLRNRLSLAALFQSSNELAQAENVLSAAEKDLGTSPDLLRAWVIFWLQRGGDEAKKALTRLADASLQFPIEERPALLNELARAYYRLGDSTQVARLWGEFSKLQQPDNLAVLSLWADLAVAVRDRSIVEEIIEHMKTVEGEDGGTAWRSVRANYLIGEVARNDAATANAARAEASELVDAIFARRARWWVAYVLRGRLAELAARPDEAIKDYLQAIDLGGSEPELARRLFVLLYQRDQFDELDEVVKKLSERGMAPDDLKLATAMGAAQRADFGRAITLAREVVPENSSGASDLLVLCNLLLQAGRLNEVERPLRRAKELAPGLPGVWVTQVQFLVNSGRTAEIPSVLEQAERALPSNEVAGTLARCYSIAGNFEQAAKKFQLALDLRPGDAATIRLAAEFYIKALRLDKAMPLVERLIDPKTKALPADIAWANRARALVKMQSGDPRQIDEALALIAQNLKSNPYTFEDRKAQAILLTMIPKRLDEGIRALETLSKSRLLSREDRFLLAQAHGRRLDWPKYQELMLGLMKERQPSPSHVAHFVNALIDHGELAQAERWLELYKPASASFGQLRSQTELKGRLLKARKRDDQLLALLREFSKNHPDQARAAAELFERFGYPKQAEQEYRAVAAQKADESIRLLPLARVVGAQDRTQEALNLCTQASKTSPAEAVAATYLTILTVGKNVTDEQRQSVEFWLTDALRRQPGSVPIRLCVAALRNLQQRFDETESIYDAVLNDSPNNLPALNNLAWLLAFRSGREPKAKALELIDRAIDLAGSNATLLDTRAVVYLQLGKPDLALQDLNGALAINPDKPVLYFHLARALELANNPAEARAALREAEQRGVKAETMDPREREIFLDVSRKLSES
jgi:tetratricopeptide (TPR) repeat protein